MLNWRLWPWLPSDLIYDTTRRPCRSHFEFHYQTRDLLNRKSGLSSHECRSRNCRIEDYFQAPAFELGQFEFEDANDEDEELRLALAASLESKEEAINPTSTNQADDSNVDKEAETHSMKKHTYPPLPEEPKGDRNLLCRVGIRLPDGRRLQRNFLRKDPIKLLWSFCYSQLKEAETCSFRLTQAIPGASKSLDYESDLTFEESGLVNSMISVTWE